MLPRYRRDTAVTARRHHPLPPPPPLPAPSLSLLLLLTLLLADKTAASYNGSYTCAHYCSNVATGLL